MTPAKDLVGRSIPTKGGQQTEQASRRQSPIEVLSKTMAILKVAKLGNPVLRQLAQPVPVEALGSHRIRRLIEDMIATVREYGGVGLAAPQVHEPVQIAIIGEVGGLRVQGQEPTQFQVLINPLLAVVSEEREEDWEGCLSIPDLRGKVVRHREIQVRALNAEGEQVQFVATGFRARVIQHEHDHLIGKVYLDRMRSFESLAFLQEFSRYWQNKTEGERECPPKKKGREPCTDSLPECWETTESRIPQKAHAIRRELRWV